MTISYLVHDLHDAAVVRRIALLRGQGKAVRVAGFRRRDEVPAEVAGAPALDLGRTRDGRLAERVLSVLRHVLRPGRLRRLTTGADVLLARNLEALVLAARVRRPGQRLVYECLDIHRLLLGSGLASRLLLAIEHWAMRGVDLVVVSAPAFRDAYFVTRRGWQGPVLLVENKVQSAALPGPERLADADALTPDRPWVIGWFGMLRCRRTLDILGEVVRKSEGRVKVVIAGVPSAAVFEDFAGSVARYPGVCYLGPYTPADLPRLFATIDFIWAIDYFEEGLNSAWLLPNRLYEGLAHGAVPLALANVETGAWLRRNGVGVLLDDPVAELPALLAGLSPAGFRQLRDAVAALPGETVWMSPAECATIAARIAGSGEPAGSGMPGTLAEDAA